MELNRSLAIIGAGRAGRALGRGLRESGWRVTAVVTRSAASAKEAARVIGGAQAYSALTRLTLEAGNLLLATPECAIPQIAGELAEMGGQEWRGKVVLHTGSADHTSLEPLARAGAATGSLRLFHVFDPRQGGRLAPGGERLPELDGVMVTVEGHPLALRVARRMVRDLGGLPVQLTAADKVAAAAAAEMASAQVAALTQAAARILQSGRVSRRQALRAALHLSRAALHYLERYGSGEGWAPVPDHCAVAAQMHALGCYPSEYGGAYSALRSLGTRMRSRLPAGSSWAAGAIELRAKPKSG
jgi:predicted short-subunit dehydrogenase-like oxidoreductase (DUF2520 family)